MPFLLSSAIASAQFAVPVAAAQTAIIRLGGGEFFRDRTEHRITWQVNALAESPAISQAVKLRLSGKSGIVEVLDESPKRQVWDSRITFNPRYQFVLSRRETGREWTGGASAFPLEGFGALGHTEVQNYFPNGLFKIRIAGDFYTNNELESALTGPNYRSRFRWIGDGEFLLEGKYAAPEGEYVAEYEFAIRMPLDKPWAYIRSCRVVHHYADPPDYDFVQSRETIHTVEETESAPVLRSRKTEMLYAKKFEGIGSREYRTQFEYSPIKSDENAPEFTLPYYGFPEPDLEIHLPVIPPPRSKPNSIWAWSLVSIPLAAIGILVIRRRRKLNAGSGERR